MSEKSKTRATHALLDIATSDAVWLYIGAHAAVAGMRLLTCDATRYEATLRA